ncbi:hypothetical protein MNBD_GAMMA15-886 [hydrothermal vent metagenome]|uniref:N-acetyltransferase domain-containing protein n=1 Tax=hydrothermal vent metagenome TaxID=652676 RepID=A0A3B0ZEF5_9ZZZZ
MFSYADPQTIDQIHALLLKEAAQGHFEPRMLEPVRAGNMRNNLLSMMHKQERIDENLRAELLVWTEQGKTIGWLVNSEIVRGAGNELWMLLIQPDHRGTGAGGRMLDAAIADLRDKVDVYARCYPTSTMMIGMFERRGFHLLDTDDSGNLTLKLLQTGSAETLSGKKKQTLRAHVPLPVEPG